MGVLFNPDGTPDLLNYEREMNPDGSEKHVRCEGAYYHVLAFRSDGLPHPVGRVEVRCSEPNCEINNLHERLAPPN